MPDLELEAKGQDAGVFAGVRAECPAGGHLGPDGKAAVTIDAIEPRQD